MTQFFPSPTLVNSTLGESTNDLTVELFLSREDHLLKDTDLGSRFLMTKLSDHRLSKEARK